MKNDTNNVGVELYAWGKLLQPLAIPSKMPFHSSLCTNLHVVTSQSPMLVQLLKVILWKSQATFVGRHNILHNHLYKVRCTCMFVCVKKHAILRNKLHIYIYTYIWLHIYLVDIRTLLSFYLRIHPLHSLFLFHVLCLSWLCHFVTFVKILFKNTSSENFIQSRTVFWWYYLGLYVPDNNDTTIQAEGPPPPSAGLPCRKWYSPLIWQSSFCLWVWGLTFTWSFRWFSLKIWKFTVFCGTSSVIQKDSILKLLGSFSQSGRQLGTSSQWQVWAEICFKSPPRKFPSKTLFSNGSWRDLLTQTDIHVWISDLYHTPRISGQVMSAFFKSKKDLCQKKHVALLTFGHKNSFQGIHPPKAVGFFSTMAHQSMMQISPSKAFFPPVIFHLGRGLRWISKDLALRFTFQSTKWTNLGLGHQFLHM